MIIGCVSLDGAKQKCENCLLEDSDHSCFDFRKSIGVEVTTPINNVQ